MTNQKIIFITGGTSGIGREIVKGLASTGATTVFTARDVKKGEDTKREIIKETGNNNVEYLMCDLASFSSIRECAEEFKKRYQRLDVLINNAGVLTMEKKESEDGIELDFAVNFLAPFLLTNLLLPIIKRSAPARVINVSSSMHIEGKINFDDLESKKVFNKYKAYAQSKLALILFTKKLAKELSNDGVTINALNPGVVGTEMTMQNVRTLNPIVSFIYRQTLITPVKGAETSIYLATSPDVANISGKYFDNKKQIRASARSDDDGTADRLCEVAKKMVGL